MPQMVAKGCESRLPDVPDGEHRHTHPNNVDDRVDQCQTTPFSSEVRFILLRSFADLDR